MEKEKVLIIGVTPETAGVGGVSIHVSRLLSWLRYLGYSFDYIDYKKNTLWHQWREIIIHKVVHIHISRPLPRFIYIFIAKLFHTKVVFTIHGDVGRFGYWGNLLDKYSIKMSTFPIAINHHSYELAKKWNYMAEEITVFLPPLKEEKLPETVMSNINVARDGNKIIASANASVMSFTPDGKEIYGIDFLVSFFRGRNEFHLFISDPSGQYNLKYGAIPASNITFITEPHSFYELMRYSDVMIRPTATDGDAISVREGLYLNKKVIATDCVDRPEGVFLFHYNDSISFANALNKISKTKQNYVLSNPIKKIISLYNKCLKE